MYQFNDAGRTCEPPKDCGNAHHIGPAHLTMKRTVRRSTRRLR